MTDVVQLIRLWANDPDAGVPPTIPTEYALLAVDEIERLRSEIGMITPIGDDSDIKPHDHLGNRNDHADELVAVLRYRACPAGLAHTGNNPKEDHGHTDCWLHHQSADEIERLRALITEWADADDDPADIDGPYHAAWLKLRQAVGR
jgi:hypothetical protein